MKDLSTLQIDCTHVGRRETGIERITLELFGADALNGIPFENIRSRKARIFVLIAQMIALPLYALTHPHDVFLFPGFPPSPLLRLARKRCVMYVHDLFLLTRRVDLNLVGKLYLSPLFAFAVRHLKYFFVNSENTGRALRGICRRDAQIMLYRPTIRNVFNLAVGDRFERPMDPKMLRFVAIGTVEPRKNFVAAADICAALARQHGGVVELNIIGRRGWGRDWNHLRKRLNVKLHGTLRDEQARAVIEAADIFICSSHDEGLGLPLLEVQHGGLPTVAPDGEIFREVLGHSGIYVDPSDPERAATIVSEACNGTAWRRRQAEAAIANLRRWNDLAAIDHNQVLSFLKQLLLRSSESQKTTIDSR
jgi:glycosyltransferase involved in cell wall biosynthesis